MTILCYFWIIFSSVENHKNHNFVKSDYTIHSDYLTTPIILTTLTTLTIPTRKSINQYKQTIR